MGKHETVYCIKYALTTGITKVDGYEHNNGWFMQEGGQYTLISSKQWARSPQEAIELAKLMRDKKLVSLQKSITKLENLDFTVPE